VAPPVGSQDRSMRWEKQAAVAVRAWAHRRWWCLSGLGPEEGWEQGPSPRRRPRLQAVASIVPMVAAPLTTCARPRGQ
jgi:hypothetical protein